MGQGWRRVSEAVLQRTAISFSHKQRNFKATSNGRNEAMFNEATKFAQSIKLLEKDLKCTLKSIDTQYKNLRGILLSPVPRIYDEGEHGPVATEDEPRILGADMDVEAIPRAAEEARRRITQEVMDPLNEWMGAYKVIADRMRSLEALRLELDSRRRTVVTLQDKLEQMRSHNGQKPKAIAELKETEETMARKEDKMARTYQGFQELERTVYNSLYTLVRDTHVLRDYTHAALTIVQECFQQAAAAYSSAPNPQFSSNNAAGYIGEKDAGTPGGKTPKGVIGRMIDGIRGKSSRIPESPVAMRDASDQHDQVPYMPPPYQQQPYQQPYQQQQYQRVTGPAPASGPMAQMPAAYTRRTDMDMPNTAAYIQPAPASNGYMASPTYRYPAQAPAPMAGGPMGGQGWTAEGY